LLLGFALAIEACRLPARSRHSYDEIRALVAGKTEAEVERILGTPDVRQPVLLDDERWIWWNYTFLEGDQYAPQIRGQVVHLEIVFQNPANPGEAALPMAAWRVSQPLAVSYSTPLPSAIESSVRWGATP
jgi:hypothetical protein